MSGLRAVVITPAARDWLARPATARVPAARVLNVFERACNLVNDRGEVLAVVTSERGLTPFALVVEARERAPFRDLTQASEIMVTPGELRLGPLAIETAGARLWDPAPDWPAIRPLFAGPEAIEGLAAGAAGRGPAGSLLELFAPAGSATALPAAFRSRAREGALALLAGWQAGSLETAAAGACRLAGLGGGLTPAGDDFILGTLLGAWAGLYGPDAEKMAEGIVAAAAPRTTTLSAAYLRAAARGECSAYWHDLFAALLRPALRAAGVPAALSALLAVGHTSGADALAGFLAAQRLTVHPQPTPTGV